MRRCCKNDDGYNLEAVWSWWKNSGKDVEKKILGMINEKNIIKEIENEENNK